MAFKIRTVKKTSLPDERQVLESMTRLRHGMSAHAKMLLTGIAILLALVAIAGGVYLMNVQAEQAARDRLQQGTQLYMNRPLIDTDASLSHARQAAELFRSVIDDYPGSSSAPLAMNLLANALSVLGDHDGAIAMYQRFLETYPSQWTLRALVLQRLAYAYLEKGDLQRAQRTFETILTIDKAPNKDLALLELAGLGEQQNQSEAALARYQELIKGYPHSIYLSEASSKVRVLGGGEGAPGTLSPDPTAPQADSADESSVKR